MKAFIDLTHKINDKISLFPGDKPPHIETTTNVKKDGHKTTSLQFHSHISTHMDAPSHIIEDGKNLDQIDISQFFGRAYIADCSDMDEISKDYLSCIHDKIKYADFLLFYTGKHKKWGTPIYTRNLILLNEEGAKWLSMLPLKGVGIDAISFDRIDADPFKNELIIHSTLLSKDILLIENLNNLEQITGKFIDFACLPLYYENADGSPVRAVAQYDS
jgi:kynurenine formamidase